MGRVPSISFLLAVALWGSAALNSPLVSAAPVLAEKVEVLTAKAGNAGSIDVSYSLTNRSPNKIRVLKWNTPLEGAFNAPVLTVTKEGATVPYIGRLVKRGNPKPTDYVEIAPDQTMSQRLDVTDGYLISDQGTYTVALPRNSVKVQTLPSKGLASKAVSEFVVPQPEPSIHNTIDLTAARQTPQVFFAKQLQTLSATELANVSPKAPEVDANACTAAQSSIIQAAVPGALQLAKGSSASLSANSTDAARIADARYKQWFGAATTARYLKATANFQKIESVLATENVTVTCDCSAGADNWFAYVQRGVPYNVHLCGMFWKAKGVGTDSQSGTFVHEISHFTVVADTLDKVYGHADASRLAESNPDEALRNADNYEYHAENTP